MVNFKKHLLRFPLIATAITPISTTIVAQESTHIFCLANHPSVVPMDPKLERELNFKLTRDEPEALIAFRVSKKITSVQYMSTETSCSTKQLTAKFVKHKIRHGTQGKIELSLEMLVQGQHYPIKVSIGNRYDIEGKMYIPVKKNLMQYCGKPNKQDSVRHGLLYLPLRHRCRRPNTIFFGFPASEKERLNLGIGQIRCKRKYFFQSGKCAIQLSYYHWPMRFSFPFKLLPQWREVRRAAIAAIDENRVLLISPKNCIGEICDDL